MVVVVHGRCGVVVVVFELWRISGRLAVPGPPHTAIHLLLQLPLPLPPTATTTSKGAKRDHYWQFC